MDHLTDGQIGVLFLAALMVLAVFIGLITIDD